MDAAPDSSSEDWRGEFQEVQAEILRTNTEARFSALQIAVFVPLTAGLLGLLNTFRMVKLPDLELPAAAEGLLMG